MVRCEGRYDGNLKVTTKHLDSNVEMITDAPRDLNGDGSSFSPTDLVGVSLATCILTTLGIVAKRDEMELGEASFFVEKEMSTDLPRRIGRLTLEFHLASAIPLEYRTKLENAGAKCPVKQSIHPEVQLSIKYIYDQ